MIEQTSFLGMPLRTQRQRRLLVVLYYMFFLLVAILGLRKPNANIGIFMPQIFLFGGLLGGIKIGGLVKLYSDNAAMALADTGGIQTLNLSGRKPFALWRGSEPLDERERHQRDAAHYKAYRILYLTLGLACLLYWASLDWTLAWFGGRLPVLAWLLLIYVLSLPQSVLLWTEPEAPVADLIEMPASHA